MLTDNLQIAIIGGGPGGLVLARLLQLRGVTVKVYERDRDRHARQQGATLDLHEESGLEALRQAGLMDAFRQLYRPGADRIKVTDAQGVVLFSDHGSDREANFGDPHFRPEIDRGPLRDLLLGSLQEGTIEWDCAFSSMEKRDGRWQLHFSNGRTAPADLVIAADGAASRVRPYLSDTRPVYSGITVVEGNIYHAAQQAPDLYRQTAGGKIFALGGEKSIILSAKGDGALSFYTGTKEEEGWTNGSGIDFQDKDSVLRWFRERFAGWSPLWQELFSAADLYIVPRPMYHYPPDQRWDSRADLTVLGDAAHRMPPYAGEGVNMAMQDALELARCLTDGQYNTTRAAIAAYEEEMRRRAGGITAMTLRQTEALHAADGLQYLLRLFNDPS